MFDLNILCVGQKTPTITIPNNNSIRIESKNISYKKRKKYYYQIAPLMNYIDGTWYELLCSEYEIAGTNICDYAVNSSGTYPYWISSAEIKDDLRTLIINKEYRDSLFEIIKFLVKKSPIHTIILFCRYQSNDAEVMCGTLSIDDFISLLDQRKILTNVCYSISDVVIKDVDPSKAVICRIASNPQYYNMWDAKGNSLDFNRNIVDPDSPDAQIPFCN